MKLKVLSVAFLCLLSVSIICNVATVMVNATEDRGCRVFTYKVPNSYFTTNGTEPTGDPIDGDGPWPIPG